MPDPADQIVLDSTQELHKLKSLATLVLDRQSTWETNLQRTNFVTRAKNLITYCRDDLDINIDVQAGTGRAHDEQAGKMFTSRPASILEDSADAFCGNLFVPTGWFGYEVMDNRVQQMDEVQAWLQRTVDYFENVISESNFYPQMPNVAMDSLNIGDGVLFVGEDEKADRPYCHYWDILSTWFTRDRWGSIISVHHRWHFSALEAYLRWGTKCSTSLIQDAIGNKPNEGYDFIQSIYQRSDPLLKGSRFEYERLFVELWVQEENDKNDLAHATNEWSDPRMHGILEQGGYHSMPVIDWPYWWKSSETYGRSPTHLVSVKRLHAAWKAAIMATQRLAAQPLMALEELKDLLDLNPDGVTWVKDMNLMSGVSPLYKQPPDPSKMLDLIKIMEEEVRDMLKLNVFLAMTLKTKDMRVDEVMQVIGEQAAILSPRIGLMSSLFLDKFHERIWNIETERGRIAATEPPDIIFLYLRAQQYETTQRDPRFRRFKGLPIRVRYKGPLQVAQDSYFVQRRLAAGLAPILTYLHPLDPNAVTDKIDVAVATEETLDQTQFMQKAIRSDRDFAARQKARADLERAQIEAGTKQQEATAFEKTAQAAKIVGGG